MIKGRWIALICAALLAMSGCGAREKGAQSSEEALPQSSQASQQESSQAKEADPSPEGESGEPVDEAALRAAIKDTGYEVKEVSSAPCEKKGLFGVFKR